MSLYDLPFLVFFAQYTNLCFDTVTLKKKQNCIKLVIRKEKKWLFYFIFLHSCTCIFVPKVLFTCVNNSCEQCHTFGDPHRVLKKKALFYLKRVCKY